MKLTLTEFLSLDGVSQGPGSPDEDTSDGFTRGGWFVPHMDEQFMQLAAQWLGLADALLLGRRTYTNFARDWPQIDDDLFSEKMNGLPKYVASTTLTSAEWAPSTILSENVAGQVAALKKQDGREIQIHGSADFAQSMLAAGLIDELRLVIAPVVVGEGRRLFPTGGAPAGLRLTSQQSTPGGLSILQFETTGAPRYDTYDGPG